MTSFTVGALFVVVGLVDFHEGGRYFGLWYVHDFEPYDYLRQFFAVPIPGEHRISDKCFWCFAEKESAA